MKCQSALGVLLDKSSTNSLWNTLVYRLVVHEITTPPTSANDTGSNFVVKCATVGGDLVYTINGKEIGRCSHSQDGPYLLIMLRIRHQRIFRGDSPLLSILRSSFSPETGKLGMSYLELRDKLSELQDNYGERADQIAADYVYAGLVRAPSPYELASIISNPTDKEGEVCREVLGWLGYSNESEEAGKSYLELLDELGSHFSDQEKELMDFDGLMVMYAMKKLKDLRRDI